MSDGLTPTSETPTSETPTEASARRAIHVVGAGLIALVVIILIAALTGGSRWAKHRQMRAIQEVAKADLELVAQAEHRFFAQHGFYTTDLNALEIRPKKVLYAFGFVKAAAFHEARQDSSWNPETRTISRLVELLQADPKWAEVIGLSPATGVIKVDFDRLISYCPDCTASRSSFKVVAAANLDSDPVLDIWVMNEKNEVRHILDDLK